MVDNWLIAKNIIIIGKYKHLTTNAVVTIIIIIIFIICNLLFFINPLTPKL